MKLRKTSGAQGYPALQVFLGLAATPVGADTPLLRQHVWPHASSQTAAAQLKVGLHKPWLKALWFSVLYVHFALDTSLLRGPHSLNTRDQQTSRGGSVPMGNYPHC